jgi:hypothetical protein
MMILDFPLVNPPSEESTGNTTLYCIDPLRQVQADILGGKMSFLFKFED